MRTFRSSIFSFDTLSGCDPRRSGAWQTLLLTLCLVGLAELGARAALAPIGSYWEYWSPQAAAKFEQYRQDVRRGSPPELLAVGDSTAARDIDPGALAEAAGVTRAFNLAWPANFPQAFKGSTLPLLDAAAVPEVVLVSFSPTGFVDSPRVRRFEEAIVASPYVRQLRGERQVTDHSYLARLRPALPFYRNWWTGGGLPRPQNGGFMPLTGFDDSVPVGDDPGPFDADRFAAIERLRAIGQRRGFAVVVIVPPRRDPSAARLDAEAAYLTQLSAGRFDYLDFRDAPFLSKDDFYDGGHLNRSGARNFSVRLGAAVRDLRTQSPPVRAGGDEKSAS